MKKILNEFKNFILRGNVMDMAIGVIIGASFSSIITALTDDFINPLINSIGGAEVAGKIHLVGEQYLNWGHFVTTLINFLITAFILFIILKGFNKMMTIGRKKKEDPELPPPPKPRDIELLEEIRDALKK